MSTCGYVPAPQAVYFVENHDEQMDCADPSKCAALTYKDGNLYKARSFLPVIAQLTQTRTTHFMSC